MSPLFPSATCFRGCLLQASDQVGEVESKKTSSKAESGKTSSPGAKGQTASSPAPKAQQTTTTKANIAKASKLKQKFLNISAKAASLQKVVTTQPEWEWANNDANIGVLTKALERMETMLKDKNLETMIHCDLVGMRKQDDFDFKLCLLLEMGSVVDQTESAHVTIMKMHAARSGKKSL